MSKQSVHLCEPLPLRDMVLNEAYLGLMSSHLRSRSRNTLSQKDLSFEHQPCNLKETKIPMCPMQWNLCILTLFKQLLRSPTAGEGSYFRPIRKVRQRLDLDLAVKEGFTCSPYTPQLIRPSPGVQFVLSQALRRLLG